MPSRSCRTEVSDRPVFTALYHSRIVIPGRYKDETGLQLGNWVLTRRTEYKNGNLQAERIKALEEVPGWVWDAQSRGT